MMLVPATERDFEAVNALARQVHELHVSWRPDLFRSCQFPLSEEDYQDLLENDGLYVLHRRGRVIAYVAFDIWRKDHHSVVPRTVLVLEQICVDEGCRGQGIGKQIMKELQILAQKRDCTDLQLTCDPHNTAAVSLYESMGMNVKCLQYHLKL